MIKPKTIGPDNDWCAICGGCFSCLIDWPILGAVFVSGSLN
jgi:hypothetical protein